MRSGISPEFLWFERRATAGALWRPLARMPVESSAPEPHVPRADYVKLFGVALPFFVMPS